MAVGPDVSQSGSSKIYVKQQPQGTTLNGNAITTEEVFDANSLQNVYGLEALNGVVLPGKVTFAIAPGSANVCNVTITVCDNGGHAITGTPFHFDVQLSDAATGIGQTATTASGTVTTTTGVVTTTYAAKKALYVETDTNGVVVLAITDTAKTGFYVAAIGATPYPFVSRQLLTADFG
jgi:hypothetical protein